VEVVYLLLLVAHGNHLRIGDSLLCFDCQIIHVHGCQILKLRPLWSNNFAKALRLTKWQEKDFLQAQKKSIFAHSKY
jgi:hypothetical protein